MQDANEITLGAVTVTRVEEMHGPIMPADQFFPDLPEQAWKEHRAMLVPDHHSPDDAMVHVAMQTWLLRSGGQTILIDTGVGNDKARPAVRAWDHLHLDIETGAYEVLADDISRQVKAGLAGDLAGLYEQLTK
ncbi:hypothetical protein ABZ464_50205 [Streptomyces sp. NPDC005820]|uniref:hypothetical protein n=1 Tax=Streptomyces sp. NPDC005820 TaxID=3157069 RepID=UPI0033F6DDDD